MQIYIKGHSFIHSFVATHSSHQHKLIRRLHSILSYLRRRLLTHPIHSTLSTLPFFLFFLFVSWFSRWQKPSVPSNHLSLLSRVQWTFIFTSTMPFIFHLDIHPSTRTASTPTHTHTRLHSHITFTPTPPPTSCVPVCPERMARNVSERVTREYL